MKLSAFIIVAALLAGGSSAARAQSPTQREPVGKTQEQATVRKTTPVERDSVTIADVKRAADDLAIAVQEVVRKVTESPELKVAALKLAANAVNAAQVVVAQQALTLQATLEALAKEVAAVSAQQTKPKAH